MNPVPGIITPMSVLRSFCLLLIFLTACSRQESQVNLSEVLLPAPRKIEFKEDVRIKPEKFRTIFLYAKADEKDQFAANLLRDEMKKLFDLSVSIESINSYADISGPSIVLGIPSRDPEFAKYRPGLPAPGNETEESYVLDANEGTVIVSGGGASGLFYGIQTLIQLMEEASWGGGSFPGVLIQDWPQMKLRMVHYNYFFHLDRFEYLADAIKKLSKYKINGIVLEFEDRFKYRLHPTLAAPTSFTAEQVQELTRLGHQYHLDIIPLVQGLGHAGFILKHDEFKHLREDPEIVQSCCPLNEGTYDLLFDMYRETIDATPGVKYFHIGGDEVRYMGICPECKKKKAEIGDLGLYLTWLNRVHQFMKDNGRTLIFWDDMPLKQAGIYRLTHTKADEKFDSTWSGGIVNLESIINKFPKDAVFMRWNYELGREKGNIQILDWYMKNDFDVTIATAIIPNWPLIPDYTSTPGNIRSFVTLGAEKKVMGQLCTAWGDDAGNHSEIYWLGFLASAEYSWNSDDPVTLDKYWSKYLRRFFGPHTEELGSAFHNLSDRVRFWNSGLLKRGQKHRRGYQLIALPDVTAPPAGGSWTAQFQSIVDTAKAERVRCMEALEILDRNSRKVKDNAYNLEVFYSMGSFMKAHCDLVITLGEIAGCCDKAVNAHNSSQKQEVTVQLNKMADLAGQAWKDYTANYEDLKAIWEKSRYPKGEEGYIMDPQTNYLAGWTADLSYLILAEQKLDLPGYADKLRKMAERYNMKGSFTE